MISEVARKLGLNRSWLSQNLKLDREAPEDYSEKY